LGIFFQLVSETNIVSLNNNKNQREGSAEMDIKGKRGLPFQKDQEEERRDNPQRDEEEDEARF
jgi:hypothetical protein